VVVFLVGLPVSHYLMSVPFVSFSAIRNNKVIIGYHLLYSIIDHT
jgi:hypothetical protein